MTILFLFQGIFLSLRRENRLYDEQDRLNAKNVF